MSLPQTIGKYEIQRLVGKGAMGVVYRSRDTMLDRIVALKVIRKDEFEPSTREQLVKRFRLEARAAARLQHPNIASVYDLGETEEFGYIAMEFVEGRELKDLLADPEPIPLPKLASIFGQLLEALQAAHSQGIVHRDVKPANILITDAGQVKVTDFGIAKIVGGNHTTIGGAMFGTPSYMSPEQVRGLEVDQRADIFSAGAILYEALTGLRPFRGSLNAILHAIVNEPPEAPSDCDRRPPHELDDVVLKALAKDPNLRYQSARTFKTAFTAALHKLGFDDIAVGSGRQARPTPMAIPTPITVIGVPESVSSRHRGETPATAALDKRVRNAGPATAANPTTAGGPSAAKLRVLFVDDDERLLNSLKSQFRPKFDVATDTDPENAIQLLKHVRFQAILCDQRMPKVSGVEVLREAKRLQPGATRLLFSGYPDFAMLASAINSAEIHRFISKPWEPDELARTLDEAVGIATAIQLAGGIRESQAWPDAVTSVLVIDHAPQLARDIEGKFDDRVRVTLVETTRQAIDLIATSAVQIVILWLSADDREAVSFLKAVKMERPHIVTIGVAESLDSEWMIELINQAHLYRCLNFPVEMRRLEQYVDEALRAVRMRETNPVLLQREQVHEPAAAGAAGIGKLFLDKLRAFRIFTNGAR